MGLFGWAESRIRTFGVWDMGIIKVCIIAFTLMIAKLWPGILTLGWYWYGLVFAVSYIWIMIRLLKNSKA